MNNHSRHQVRLEELRCLAEWKVPARVDAQQTAALLGFAEHDVPVLVLNRLLKPLGKPAQNGTKWFSTDYILELTHDREWLDKATAHIQAYWRNKHGRRRARAESTDTSNNLDLPRTSTKTFNERARASSERVVLSK